MRVSPLRFYGLGTVYLRYHYIPQKLQRTNTFLADSRRGIGDLTEKDDQSMWRWGRLYGFVENRADGGKQDILLSQLFSHRFK
jgi:hypothetical protein